MSKSIRESHVLRAVLFLNLFPSSLSELKRLLVISHDHKFPSECFKRHMSTPLLFLNMSWTKLFSVS